MISFKQYSKLSKAINPFDKIVLTNKPEINLSFNYKQDVMSDKPHGLWYATGAAWIDYILHRGRFVDVDQLYESAFKLDINYDRMVQIVNFKTLRDFTHEYMAKEMPNIKPINWRRVALSYSGIEISPYVKGGFLHFPWYVGWSIASGCIWSRDAINKIERIEINS